jgi:hypothetical protein
MTTCNIALGILTMTRGKLIINFARNTSWSDVLVLGVK